MQTLYLIPARGGSKGLPGKNIKKLKAKPLLEYSIDFARRFTPDANICVSTDAQEITDVARACGLTVPFVRPASLSGDTVGSREVILHALSFYEEQGIHYEAIILLQPTSPFRSEKHLVEMQKLYSSSLDMVVSVVESHRNPYFSLFEETAEGYLTVSKPSNFIRRQDCPQVYAYNGALYVINVASIKKQNLNQFPRVKKFVMDEIHSVDIDTEFDWLMAETIIEKSLWKAG